LIVQQKTVLRREFIPHVPEWMCVDRKLIDGRRPLGQYLLDDVVGGGGCSELGDQDVGHRKRVDDERNVLFNDVG
jgi:hypothetical protein